MSEQGKKDKPVESLVDFLNDAVYTIDLKTFQFTSVNLAGERLTGYKAEELLKLPFAKVVVPKYLPLIQKMIAKKQKKDVSTIYEIEILKKNGTMVPVEISSRVIFENGEPVRILGIARDITERKHHQNQKDIFIGLITHEIKNPLTSIILYTELLQKIHKTHEKSKEHFEIIRGQTKIIEQLMEDFLGVTQLQMGQFTIIKEKVDLKKEIEHVVRSFQKLYDHQIDIQGDIKSEVFADRNRICQVLTNLISNAIKYSPPGKEINILLSETKKEIKVGIQDFGIGIEKAEHKRIFELFTRTADAMKSNIKGHGLGLYISREIIKHHKGKLWVESEPDKGSTFFFTLPITQSKS